MKLNDALYLEWQEVFPDWKEMKPGEWSSYNRMIRLDDETELEISLYREPVENTEYLNTYTLQIFVNDNLILCKTVKEENEDD